MITYFETQATGFEEKTTVHRSHGQCALFRQTNVVFTRDTEVGNRLFESEAKERESQSDGGDGHSLVFVHQLTTGEKSGDDRAKVFVIRQKSLEADRSVHLRLSAQLRT